MSEATENSRLRYAKPAWLRTSVLCRRDAPITSNWQAIGWVAEIVVRKLWPQEADRFATLSFTLGLQFSVLLTLVPAVLMLVATLFMVLARLSGAPQKPAPPFY